MRIFNHKSHFKCKIRSQLFFQKIMQHAERERDKSQAQIAFLWMWTQKPGFRGSKQLKMPSHTRSVRNTAGGARDKKYLLLLPVLLVLWLTWYFFIIMIVTETATPSPPKPQSVNPAGKRSRITAAVAPDYFPQAARLINTPFSKMDVAQRTQTYFYFLNPSDIMTKWP